MKAKGLRAFCFKTAKIQKNNASFMLWFEIKQRKGKPLFRHFFHVDSEIVHIHGGGEWCLFRGHTHEGAILCWNGQI